MDYMGSYVPNTSRRVLGILFFFWGGEASASQLPRVLFSKIFDVFKFCSTRFFFEFYFLVIFLFLGIEKL